MTAHARGQGNAVGGLYIYIIYIRYRYDDDDLYTVPPIDDDDDDDDLYTVPVYELIIVVIRV